MDKKLIKFVCLALAGVLVAGCETKTSTSSSSTEAPVSTETSASNTYGDSEAHISSSSQAPAPASKSSSGQTSSSSSSTNVGPTWDAATKALMEKYCGEVLPYVALKDGFVANESEDNYGDNYLEIYDYSDSFTIEDYHQKLTAAGWTMQTVDGSIELIDDYGDSYYSAYKKANGGLDVYTLRYYFYAGYGNCIDAYHYKMCGTLDTATTWDADLKKLMLDTLTVELPFVQMGSDYDYALEEGDLYIFDTYKDSLVDNWVKALTSNGYAYEKTDEYGDKVYLKTLEDGAQVRVTPYYTIGLGNVADANYTPRVDTYNTWPTSVFADIEAATGYTIPSFTASSYAVWTQNGVITVYVETSTSMYDDYAKKLDQSGYVVSDYVASNFEETLQIAFSDDSEYDEDWNEVINGFYIQVSLTEATSTFAASFPSAEVSAYIKSVADVDVTVLTAEDKNDPHKDLKYYQIDLTEDLIQYVYEQEYALSVELGLYDEDEAYAEAEELASSYVGFYVNVYDPMASSYLDYLINVLNTGAFYLEGDEEMGYYAEAADGKYGFYFGYSSNVFSIQYFKGTDTVHERTFGLNKTSLSLKPGATFRLEVVSQLVPGNAVISWSSDNDTVATVNNRGLVTAGTEGTAKITAKTTVDGTELIAECSIRVTNESTTVVITPDDVPAAYDETATLRTIKGLDMYVCNVMNQKGAIQLKKNSVNMYNSTAYQPITSITFAGTNKQDTFTVYAGNSADSLTKVDADVDGTTLTYNLDGATFFKVENGKGVFTCDSITFEF